MTNKSSDFLSPEIVRTRFVQAGLFLVAHEMLLRAVKDRLHEFFANTWTAKDGWKTSSRYREEILSLDPKRKSDPLRASIVWLRQMEVIDEKDEKAIRKLTDERNRLAHELGGMLSGSFQHDFDSLFPELAALVMKIDKWWVVNVEIATNPGLAGVAIDLEGVVPGSQIILQFLEEIALGKDANAWELYNEFMAQQDDELR